MTTNAAALRRSVIESTSVTIPVLLRRQGGALERAELTVQSINGDLYRVSREGMIDMAPLTVTGAETLKGWGKQSGEAVEFGSVLINRALVNALAVIVNDR